MKKIISLTLVTLMLLTLVSMPVMAKGGKFYEELNYALDAIAD